MKRVQWKSTKYYSLLILALIAVLVIEPSCNEDDIIERPTACFVLKGTVLSDTDDQPLKDFLVILYHETKVLDSLAVDSLDILLDSAVTDAEGNFQAIDSLGIPAKSVYNLAFIDKAKIIKSNDASIDTFLTTCDFLDPKFTNGDGRWYAGETFKTETFRLEIAK